MNRGLHRGFGGGLPIQQNPLTVYASGATIDINWSQSSYIRCVLQSSAFVPNATLRFTTPIAGPSFLILQLDNFSNTGNASSTLAFTSIGNSIFGNYLPNKISAAAAGTLTFYFDGTNFFYIFGSFTDNNFTGTQTVNFGADVTADFIMHFGNGDPTITYDHLTDALRFNSGGGGGIYVDDAFFVSGGAQISNGLSVPTGGITSSTGGITSISGNFTVEGNATNTSSFSAQEYSNDATNFSQLLLFKSRNASIGGLAAVVSGDILGRISAQGVNSSNASANISAYQQMVVDGSPGVTFVPGRFEWYTGTNAAVPQLAMTLNSVGTLIVGQTGGQQTVNSLTPTIQINGLTNAGASSLYSQWTNDATGPTEQFLKSRGTSVGTMVALSASDVVTKMDFFGVNTTPAAALTASQRVIVDGSPGASFVPSRFEWWTGTNAAAAKVNLSLNNAGVLTVGNNTPNTFNSLQAALQVQGTSNATSTASLQEFSADALGATLQFFKSHNAALATYTGLSSGDVIGKMDFIGVASITTNRPSAASIQVVTDGPPSATLVPGRLEFYTGSSTVSPALQLTLDRNGNIFTNTAAVSTGQTISTTSPGITASGNAGTNIGRFAAIAYQNTASFPTFEFGNSPSGTLGTFAAATANMIIGNMVFSTVGTNALQFVSSANIRAVVDGSPGATFVPSRLEFMTATNAANPAIATVIDNGGNFIGVVPQTASAYFMGNSTGSTATTGGAINNSALALKLSVGSSDRVGEGQGMGLYRFNNSGGQFAATIQFLKSASTTMGTHTIVANGEALGIIQFGGSDGTQYRPTADIRSVVDGTPSAGAFVPGRLMFQTTTSSNASTEAMRIDSSQRIIVGTGAAAQTVNSLTAGFQTLATAQAGASNLDALYAANASGSVYQYLKSRGAAVGTITALSSGDVITESQYIGVNSSNAAAVAANYKVIIDAAPGATFVPARHEWWTGSATAGSSVALKLDSAQHLTGSASIRASTYFFVGGNASVGTNGQGAYMAWNRSGGTGETDFVNNRGGGGGGWLFVNTDGTTFSNVAQIFANGAMDFLSTTTAAPGSAQSASYGRFFIPTVGNRKFAALIDENGQFTTYQPNLGRNNVMMWDTTVGTTTFTTVGIAGPNTALGTPSSPTPATTSFFTRLIRLHSVSSAVAGNFAGWYSTSANTNILTTGGASSPATGGFFCVIRFGVSDAATVSGARMFVGLSSSVAAPTNVESNTLTNSIGVAQLSTDSTQLYIVYGGSTAQTAIALGTNFPPGTLSTDVYELALFSPPSLNNTVYYQVTRLNSSVAPATGTLTGTAGTALPANTTYIGPRMYRTNNATALAVGLDVMSVYLETDN